MVDCNHLESHWWVLDCTLDCNFIGWNFVAIGIHQGS